MGKTESQLPALIEERIACLLRSQSRNNPEDGKETLQNPNALDFLHLFCLVEEMICHCLPKLEASTIWVIRSPDICTD